VEDLPWGPGIVQAVGRVLVLEADRGGHACGAQPSLQPGRVAQLVDLDDDQAVAVGRDAPRHELLAAPDWDQRAERFWNASGRTDVGLEGDRDADKGPDRILPARSNW
jgi:hypothetical protein